MSAEVKTLQRGTFITLEGPDGGGKTTQITLLAAALRAQGHSVVTGREPGGTGIGDQIRAILHDHRNAEMNARTEFLLYAASRAQVVAQLIRPALETGQIVLLDRFIDSTFAYQGYGRGLDLGTLRLITAFATGGLVPDLTLYLDIDAAAALARREQAAQQGEEYNRMDAQQRDFYERVRSGYEDLMRQEPGRWARVDADQPSAVVHEAIWEIVREYILSRSPG